MPKSMVVKDDKQNNESTIKKQFSAAETDPCHNLTKKKLTERDKIMYLMSFSCYEVDSTFVCGVL